ncbi:uncharacterized protein Z518_10998 [Rhinocladiella mackenziei CBS 650.93]|uniref:Rhinocladiella mackenziei CBS 650.93 unplaced genomic scaffold supercont1.10, whole genome shotgun sequence n=1 Tax=Rhinocladiella mackenziei CBS 650.93 TaxID=1442369 RepID=A0A0D2IA01_9EURO|nr:uncharacterized protein Z518_10998 [Rhinocladiella mackenziei CBS 650.93]KIX00071.1 hypothetical protein Z518_10998 [Rhinocladiella mackenziei CBS 650.93]
MPMLRQHKHRGTEPVRTSQTPMDGELYGTARRQPSMTTYEQTQSSLRNRNCVPAAPAPSATMTGHDASLPLDRSYSTRAQQTRRSAGTKQSPDSKPRARLWKNG